MFSFLNIKLQFFNSIDKLWASWQKSIKVLILNVVIDPRKIDVNLSHRFSANDKWQSEKIYVDAPPPPLPPRERRLLCYTDFGAIKNHRLKRRTFCIFVLHYVCRYSKRWAALIKGRTFLHRQNLG